MGAGNVKAARISPPALKLPPIHSTPSASPPMSKHISEVVSPANKKWSVTCDVHRSLICRFCGGKSCKREDWTKQEDTSAIQGLHSTWVSANVLGMQRPSRRLIREFNIVEQFKKAGVGAVINLQLAGEHPHCGDGIDATGFSYRPEDFTDHGIFYYNPGWVDMNIPSLEKMIEIVQIMSFHSEKSQKIAVHCHAGYGRTGIVIACFFVYAYGLLPEDAIKSVRTRRKGSVQTSKQRKFVHQFYDYISFLRTIFYPPVMTSYGVRHARSRSEAAGSNAAGVDAIGMVPLDSDEEFLDEESEVGTVDSRTGHRDGQLPAVGYPHLVFPRRHAQLLSAIAAEHEAAMSNRYTLHEALSRQRAILHGAERNTLKFVPKILHVLCERLSDLATHAPKLAASAFLDGFRRSGIGSIDRRFEEERDREKERRMLRDKQRRDREGGFGSVLAESIARLHQESSKRPTSAVNPSPLASTSAPSTSDDGLVCLSTHGALSHPSIWDASSNRVNISGTGAPSEKDDGPVWTPIQTDQMAELRKKLNAGDWACIDACDIRYCAQLLLEWLDSLASPLLPLFEKVDPTAQSRNSLSGMGQGAAYSPSSYHHANHPHHLTHSTPSAVLQSLPRWTIQSLDHVFRILIAMRTVDLPILARLFARFGWALAHPRALIPDGLLVVHSHSHQIRSALGARALATGMSIQGLHQATQAQLVQAQQLLAAGSAMSPSRQAAQQLLLSPQPSFERVHAVLPPSRPLTDSLIEMMAGLTRAWPSWMMKVADADERLARDTKVGVRKPVTLPPLNDISHAQKNGDSALIGSKNPAATLLRPYHHELDQTKLVTQVAEEPTTKHMAHAPEQTQEEVSALLSRIGGVEVSTTAYLHSHIHHAQPRDREVKRIPPTSDHRAILESQGESQLLDGSFDAAALRGGVGPLDDLSRVGGLYLSRGADERDVSYLATQDDGTERLNGFITQRRLKDGGKEDQADEPDTSFDENRLPAGSESTNHTPVKLHRPSSASSSPASTLPAPGPLPASSIPTPSPMHLPPIADRGTPFTIPRAVLQSNPAAERDTPKPIAAAE